MSSNTEFFKISDTALIIKILTICNKHGISVVIWFKDQSLRFDTKVHHYYQHIQKLAFVLPESVPPAALKEALAAQKSNDIFISFQIDTVNFFIKAQVSGVADEAKVPQLSILIPKEIYKLQRRANLRIPFKRTEAPRLTCYDPSKGSMDPKAKMHNEKDILAFRMLDVSAGGFAISVAADMEERFKIGTIVEDVRFLIKGTEIACKAVVRHIRKSKNDRGQTIVRVGLQYSALKSEFEKSISAFVLDESRKQFSLLH